GVAVLSTGAPPLRSNETPRTRTSSMFVHGGSVRAAKGDGLYAFSKLSSSCSGDEEPPPPPELPSPDVPGPHVVDVVPVMLTMPLDAVRSAGAQVRTVAAARSGVQGALPYLSEHAPHGTHVKRSPS